MSSKPIRSLRSKPRKLLLLFTLTLSLAAVSLQYRVFFQRGLDKAISELLTRELEKPVSVVAAHFENWNRLHFDTMTVSSRDRGTLMASGPGQINFYGFLSRMDHPRIAVYSFKNVAILEAFYKKLPIVSWVSQYIFNDPIYLSEMKFVTTRTESGTSLRILKFYSEAIWVMGGVRFKEKKLMRANLLIAVPNATFEKLPKQIRSRMIKRREGWRAVRITFGGNIFKVEGATGPFFQASWA